MTEPISDPLETIEEFRSIEPVIEGEVMDERGTPPERLIQPWHRMPAESIVWYEKFVRYYLQLGIGRSLYKAYRLYVLTEVTDIEKQGKILRSIGRHVENAWRAAAILYQWRKRAEAWDNFEAGIDQDVVNKAKHTILSNMDKAAEALVTSLNNPRLSVMAAKEILDRGGMGAIQKVGVVAIPYTTDELQAASEALSKWKKELSQDPKSALSG